MTVWRQTATGEWLYRSGFCAHCHVELPTKGDFGDVVHCQGGLPKVHAEVHRGCVEAFNAGGSQVPDPPLPVEGAAKQATLDKLRELMERA